MRTTLSILALVAGTLLATVPAAAQGVPRLKPQVTVASDIVRVGDLVENAGASSPTPIFRAPDLGETGSVPARAVVDAVRAAGLIAVDTRGLTEVTVTHASRTLPLSEIESRLATALSERYDLGKPENLRLVFDREVRNIELSLTSTTEPIATRMNYDRASRRFDVTLEIPGASRAQWRYTGVAIETVEAAVVMRGFTRGEVIKQNDITIERRAKREFASDPAATDVVGLAARGNIRAGQVLHASELMKPEIVKKNDVVILHYEVPGIVLTMRGQALDSGAEGDMVNVLNPNSKRTIQGVVTAAGHVTVVAPKPAQIAASQTE
ncbi:MAG: flagellar basal body P-ring formation protein FlgA [Alphaproteobacteria bacterium]|nr:flagellar basal body P-ring formation protein FlgA [Alphaproteobacteria bacterium]